MINAARLPSLIDTWLHEAAVALANQRADDYAARCQQTVEALRELQLLRKAHREIICTQCGLREQLGQVDQADF